MDWDKVIADEERIMDVHYTPGRTARIDKIVLHHNGGNLSIEGCYNLWHSRIASAHYQVDENGRVGQLVNDWDTAWHAGDANPSSIGIEHANDRFGPWTISEATLDAGAHLVAALCKLYGLGEPRWGSNVFGHSHFMATSCPGEIAGSQNAAYMERARAWYASMTGGAAAPAPAPQPSQPSQGVPSLRYRVRVGGVWLPEMLDHTDTGGSADDYAGNGGPLEYIAIDMPGWYQVCTQASGWLPRVCQYDPNDLENGCAGDGSPILKVRCYYETPDPDATGWLGIEYSVANVGGSFLADMIDLDDTSGCGDDYAGNDGIVSAFRARLVRV